MDTSGAPIGLLLRKLDNLINERFEQTLGRHDVTRRQWQLLNTLARGDCVLAARFGQFSHL